MRKLSSLRLAFSTVAEGGIDAIGDDFRSGRIEYGIVTVQCNVTKQPKVLLIHWVRVLREFVCILRHYSKVKMLVRHDWECARRTSTK